MKKSLPTHLRSPEEAASGPSQLGSGDSEESGSSSAGRIWIVEMFTRIAANMLPAESESVTKYSLCTRSITTTVRSCFQFAKYLGFP